MNGKHRTLFTWFGTSDRPVAMIASGATSRARSGSISGVGLASAKMIGRAAIAAAISGFRTFGPESPRNMSAPPITSPSVRGPPGWA